jgi:hypothetical protein
VTEILPAGAIVSAALTGLPLFLFVAFLVILVVLHLAGRRYRALFRNEHLAEIVSRLARIRDEAAGRAGTEEPPRPGEMPPGTTRTSAGYRMTYSILPRDGSLEHRIAMSLHGRGFAVTAAGFLAAYLTAVLGLDEASTTFALARDGRYVLLWAMDPEGHRRFLAREIEAPDAERLAELIPDCWRRARERRASVRPLEEVDAA